MCEAATAIAVGSALVGAAMKARAAQQAGSVNAAVLEGNAALADRAASDSIARGEFGAERATLKGGELVSAQKTAYAGAGVDPSSGSPTAVAGSTAAMTALDAAIIKNNAAREAWGFATKAQDLRRQAAYTRSAASGAATQAVLGGIAGAARASIPMLSIAGQGEGDVDQAWSAINAEGGLPGAETGI